MKLWYHWIKPAHGRTAVACPALGPSQLSSCLFSTTACMSPLPGPVGTLLPLQPIFRSTGPQAHHTT